MSHMSRTQVFKGSIPQILSERGPLEMYEIYKCIEAVHLSLCTDEECVYCPQGGEYQWQHDVRNTLQQLKSNGLVEYVNKCWRLAR